MMRMTGAEIATAMPAVARGWAVATTD